jgi:phenylpyruvate tautomerase
MPMLNLKCTKDIPQELLGELSSAVAETIGKPEQYVMVVAEKTDLMMSGSVGDAACAEVKSIGGLNSSVNRELTAKLCKLLNSRLGIPANRTYVTFESLTADCWGWNNSTFG